MPQISKHRKVKRATLLVNKPKCLKIYSKKKSYKLLCEKLKINNNSLAKALSKQKQECQLLFSQNVALIAEVQDLGLACSQRDVVISNVLKNAKEMLTMLVTMTGYLTNTISTCQEFTVSSVANLRRSCNSAARRDSCKRLSTKSPTRGVVKPMVGGHTITKPTINLSRVNIQHISNRSNMSVIEEITTPPRNQELNNSTSSASVPVIRQHRYENGRTCRMPERLTVVSPRNSGETERRLSKRSSRHSGRMSARRSRLKSDRLSGSNNARRSVENLGSIGSPRVKLNDVSKLLQNSQSINIRMLTESSENGNNTSQENSETGITIPETPPSDGSNNDNIDSRNELDDERYNMDRQVKETKSDKIDIQNLISDVEDPLEGPSWLFNLPSVPCLTNDEKKTDSSTGKALNITELSDAFDSEKCMKLTSSLLFGSNKCVNQTHGFEKDKQINSKKKCATVEHEEESEENDSPCDTSISTVPTGENEYKIENEPVANSATFITQRRGYFENDDEDEDDFTLMYTPQPRNMHFDINDLKLPILEESALKSVRSIEPEPEITTTLRKISEISPVPSVSNNTLDESAFNQSTVNLPLLVNMNNDYDINDLTPLQNRLKSANQKNKVKRVTGRASDELINATITSSPFEKNVSQRRKKDQPVNKDLSTVEVVLHKLNESDIKPRTPSSEETSYRDLNVSVNSVRTDNSSDSESSNTSNTSSTSVLHRLRRKRAPVSLQEPNLRRKLRRNR